jgi:hypothetical protein
MQTSSKRIDNMEVNLTPKEWAIRLADEIRQYSSSNELLISFEKYSCSKETPFVKPFYMLNMQVEKKYPGDKPAEIEERYKYGRKLRAEYHMLKTLIQQANENCGNKSEIMSIKACYYSVCFHRIILLEYHDICEGKIGVPGKREQFSTTTHLSIMRHWRTGVILLYYEVFYLQETIKAIQENYFDNHPFIYHGIETTMKETMDRLEETVEQFNEYLIFRKDAFEENEMECNESETDNRLLPIDLANLIESADRTIISGIVGHWVKNAKDKATADFLQEMGKEEEMSRFIWGAVNEEIVERKKVFEAVQSNRTVSR